MLSVETHEDRRAALAQRVKALKDIALPRLTTWNYDGACSHHAAVGPQVDCEWQQCGGDLFGYQKVGTAWLYLAQRGLLADDPGGGKTLIILHLLALMHARKELTERALIVVGSPGAATQWAREAARFAPGLAAEFAVGAMVKKARVERYSTNWDLLIVNFQVAIKDEDELTAMAPYAIMVVDDVDPLLSYTAKTHALLTRLAGRAYRSVSVNATSLQTRLEQIHAATYIAGGDAILGTAEDFERHYVAKEAVTIFYNGVGKKVWKRTGYKNLLELRDKLKPIYMRRRDTEFDDARMPVLMPPSVVWLEMPRDLRKRYDELRKGVVRLLTEQGEHIKAVDARTAWGYGQRCCAGLPALGGEDGLNASPKLDWLESRLTGQWSDRKVVAFMINRNMIAAMEARCWRAGVGVAKVVGMQRDREEALHRFRTDPTCRLLVGTSAIERSLNLQTANILVAVDTWLNPSRMKQLLGRVRRAGSRFAHAFYFQLFMSDTQEESYLDVLRERQALNDFVFGESSQMYDTLSAVRMLEMIAGHDRKHAA